MRRCCGRCWSGRNWGWRWATCSSSHYHVINAPSYAGHTRIGAHPETQLDRLTNNVRSQVRCRSDKSGRALAPGHASSDRASKGAADGSHITACDEVAAYSRVGHVGESSTVNVGGRNFQNAAIEEAGSAANWFQLEIVAEGNLRSSSGDVDAGRIKSLVAGGSWIIDHRRVRRRVRYCR